MTPSPPSTVVISDRPDAEAFNAKLKQFVLANPFDALAYRTLGVAQFELGNQFSAKASLQQAVKLRPAYAEAWVDLGDVLETMGDSAGALRAFESALNLTPDFSQAEHRLNAICSRHGLQRPSVRTWPQARAASLCAPAPSMHPGTDPVVQEVELRRLLALDAGNANVMTQLGLMLLAQNRIIEAEHFIRHVLAADPTNVEAGLALGGILLTYGQKAKALEHAISLSQRVPDNALAAIMAMQACIELCYWDSFEQRLERTRDLVRQHPHVVEPLECALLGFSSHEISQFAQTFNTRQTRPCQPIARRAGALRDKIVLGYISADFHEHPIGRIAAQLFPEHDRNHFTVIGYSTWLADGSTRDQIAAACDSFVDLYGMTATEAATRIAQDEVDILVDLTGHTRNSRLDILELRPAPIQVNYLGYPGTTGAPFVDYVIVDHTIAPAPAALMATENVIRLPKSFFPGIRYNSFAAPSHLTRESFGLPPQGVVFCNFAAANRLMPETFRLWLRILHHVPEGVLWLGDRHPDAQHRLRAYTSAHGINEKRVIFSDRAPDNLYLARYAFADVFLDTLPFNAHSTASDALWVGCPVVTCLGETFPGRVAASLSRAAGIPELVAQTPSEYESIAIRLGNAPGELAEIRQRLVNNRSAHSLFDTARHVRYLEKAYSEMYRRLRSDLGPQSFDVQS
jgi:protein O-GlcNAc transferase